MREGDEKNWREKVLREERESRERKVERESNEKVMRESGGEREKIVRESDKRVEREGRKRMTRVACLRDFYLVIKSRVLSREGRYHFQVIKNKTKTRKTCFDVLLIFKHCSKILFQKNSLKHNFIFVLNFF